MVCEIVGDDPAKTKQLVDAIIEIGYKVEMRVVTVGLEEVQERFIPW